MIGRTLSHYKVMEELSRGGMGIVYRALDVKLDREVVLKVLPPELVADPERKRRFIQEAKAAAKLNHPHIGMVHEIDEAEGVTFIAMELIRGEQLKDIINREKLPLARALELATEIAEGLATAHEKGIVHRDLKPANIMVTEDGHAKIIDFGLAKLVEPLAGEGSDVETAIRGETDPGKVLGTVSYMSPEQARGKTVDNRSDIFSFGIMVFEMLSGRLPFVGPSGIEVLNAIIKAPAPPLSDVDTRSGTTSSELQRIVHRCLAKDPEDRYQTAKDLLSELRRMRRESDSDVSTVISETPAISVTRSAQIWRIAGAAITLVLLLAVGAYFLLPEKKTVSRLTNPVQITSATGPEYYPTWSPEGGRLAYMSRQSGNWDIWVTQIQGGGSVNLTEDNPLFDTAPSWSPDGSQIAFGAAREDTGLGYFVVSALGGTPRKVLSSTSVRPTPQWSADGTELAGVVYEKNDCFVEIVSLRSQESRRLPLPVKDDSYDLSWSPDGRFFAYVDAIDFTAEITRLWLLRVSDGEALPVTDGLTNDWSPDWSADGRTLYFVSNRGGSMDLWQQRIGEDGLLDGSPQAVTAGVGMSKAAFSADGTKLAYARGRLKANLWRVPILSDRPAIWEDAQQMTFDDAFIEFVDVSPDGERLLVSSDRKGNQDLWVLSVDGGEMRQITAEPTPDWNPSLSPDGQEIAFYAYRSGNRDIWVMPVSGGPARQLTHHEATEYHPTWSPDGEEIAFASFQSGNDDIWIVPAEGGETRQLTFDPELDNYPRFSPDGKWVLFRSYRGGTSHLWRVPRDGGEPEQLTKGPGGYPIWSRDDKKIYFRGSLDTERAGNIWALSVEDGAEYSMTDFEGRRGNLGLYALATDGIYLYFTWQEDIGDIWVMDVIQE